MASRIVESIPAAALASPSSEARSVSLALLGAESAQQSDAREAALLLHEVARLHESRDDLASAARDELESTRRDSTFIEPLQALIGIAIRSRSKTNLSKLFGRLNKLAKSADEKLEAALGLIHTQLANQQAAEARTSLAQALDELPHATSLWLALAELTSTARDHAGLLRAVLGRAAHAHNPELRSLLLERAARLLLEQGAQEEAYASLAQAYDEVPTWHALRTWETLAIIGRNYSQALDAASKTAALIASALDEPDESELYHIPRQELRVERAHSAQLRAVVYAAHNNDFPQALTLVQALLDRDPGLALAQLFRAELASSLGDHNEVARAHHDLLSHAQLRGPDSVFIATTLYLAARRHGTSDHLPFARELLISSQEPSWLQVLLNWPPAAPSRDEQFWAQLQSQVLRDDSGWFNDARVAGPLTAARASQYGLELKLIGSFSALFSLHNSRGTASGATADGWLDGLDEVGRLFAECEQLAQSSVRQTKSFPPSLRSAVRYLLARLATDRAAEATALGEQLAHFLSTSNDDSKPRVSEAVRTLCCDMLRLFLSDGGPQSGVPRGQDAQVDRLAGLLDDAWIPLLYSLLAGTDRAAALARFAPPLVDSSHGAESSQSTGSSHGARPPSTQTARIRWEALKSDPNWPRIVDAWQLTNPAPSHKQSDVAWEGHCPADDAFRVGYQLARALSEGAQSSATGAFWTVLAASTRSLTDPKLKAAWLFQAALGHLRAQQKDKALALFQQLGQVAPDVVEPLGPWIACLAFTGDPASLLASSPTLLSDVEQLCFAARYRSHNFSDHLRQVALGLAQAKEQAHLDDGRSTSALELACSLWVTDPETARMLFLADDHFNIDAHGDALLNPMQRCLLLAGTQGLTDEDRLAIFAQISQLRPCTSADLVEWAYAVRCADQKRSGQAILRLALRAEAPALISLVQPESLDGEAAQALKDVVERCLPVFSPGTIDHLRLALTQFRQAPSASLLDEANAFNRLAQALGPTDATQSPTLAVDAQLALLAAGYRYAQAKQYELALSCFLPLQAIIPTDPSLCLGLLWVAQKLGRIDLEVTCTVELARQSPAGTAAAELWERAGLLYADQLADERQAEECFNAALVHAPGSPLSFERIYRIAKRRKDRPRQIELLDARLLTADSDQLRIDLLWEKARYCRVLGRRSAALRSVAELLTIEARHLPALALSAELYLVDERWDEAALALRAVALHPQVSVPQRRNAGLYAADLFEKVKRPRDSVELLERLAQLGVQDYGSKLRLARALTRMEDWGAAYQIFVELNDAVDNITERLESAQMMLALQRDYLREPEQLRESVRRVLRDSPTDRDAIELALALDLSSEDRRHLLAQARQESRSRLDKSPLDVAEMRSLAELSFACGDPELERVALGIHSLSASPLPAHAERLNELSRLVRLEPQRPFRQDELDQLLPGSLMGSTLEFAQLLGARLTLELEADLQDRGVTALMQRDEFSADPLRALMAGWAGALGMSDFDLFVGGRDEDGIAAINWQRPTVILGRNVTLPLSREEHTRIAVLMFGLRMQLSVMVSQTHEVIARWLEAAEHVLGHPRALDGDLWESTDSALNVGKMSEHLQRVLDDQQKQRLSELLQASHKMGVSLRSVPLDSTKAALRMACLVSGDPSIVRAFPDLWPTDEQQRRDLLSDLVRFCISDSFFQLRSQMGWAQ